MRRFLIDYNYDIMNGIDSAAIFAQTHMQEIMSGYMHDDNSQINM